MNKELNRWGGGYQHHGYQLNNWSKGGSRKQKDLAILPRDLK